MKIVHKTTDQIEDPILSEVELTLVKIANKRVVSIIAKDIEIKISLDELLEIVNNMGRKDI